MVDAGDGLPTQAEADAAVAEMIAWRERLQRQAEGEPGLEQFFVHWYELSLDDVESFRTAIEVSEREQDLQTYLQSNPRILTQVLSGGHGRWLIPQQRLGAHHVTDFMLAEKSSVGFEWTAVELESPNAPLFTKAGDPARALNHAIRQVTDWRNWLSHNRDEAARPREKSGLGLIDVSAEVPGLIIIGRRDDVSDETSDRRRRLAHDHRIEIRTYDWLLDVVEGAARWYVESDGLTTAQE